MRITIEATKEEIQEMESMGITAIEIYDAIDSRLEMPGYNVEIIEVKE